MKSKISRRGFLKSLTVVALSVPVLGGSSLFRLGEVHAAGSIPQSESDPLAKSLKYCADAEKAAKAKASACGPRKEKDRAGQFCRGCQLYTKESGDGSAEVGKCMIMQGKTVAGGGWCMSWVKKPV